MWFCFSNIVSHVWCFSKADSAKLLFFILFPIFKDHCLFSLFLIFFLLKCAASISKSVDLLSLFCHPTCYWVCERARILKSAWATLHLDQVSLIRLDPWRVWSSLFLFRAFTLLLCNCVWKYLGKLLKGVFKKIFFHPQQFKIFRYVFRLICKGENMKLTEVIFVDIYKLTCVFVFHSVN